MLGAGLAFLISNRRDVRVAVGVAGVVRHVEFWRFVAVGS